MDQELRYKEHVAGKADKAFKAALALKRLQGLRPSSMRQLFSATVAPVMDHASPIWYLAISDKTLAKLERAQRVAAQAIIGGFRTMGLTQQSWKQASQHSDRGYMSELLDSGWVYTS
jgi:hypothetical protein